MNEYNNEIDIDKKDGGDKFSDMEKNIAKRKKNKRIIIVVFVACLALMAICTFIPGILNGSSGEERETYAPISPEKLHDTKEPDFDIMEYSEYLKYDRNIYFNDKNTGVKMSVEAKNAYQYGEGFDLLYKVIESIIAGDSEAYNSMVASSAGHYESFTQQQLYDIVITKYSQSNKDGDNGEYTEYVYIVEFKIHENNGTYKNNIESDASRPQYFVVNNSTGEYLVMDIIDNVIKN